MCNRREGEKVVRAGRAEKLALVLAAAFFLVCAVRFGVLYGGDASWWISTTQHETAAASRVQSDWPVSLLPGERIDLNTAPAVELTRLPQIGEKRAVAIVAWREEHGPFQSIDQLTEVSGIGPGILGQISDYITVSDTD